MYKKFAKKYHITEKQVKEMVKEINVYKCSGVNPILYINDPLHLELYKVMLKKKKKDKALSLTNENSSSKPVCGDQMECYSSLRKKGPDKKLEYSEESKEPEGPVNMSLGIYGPQACMTAISHYSGRSNCKKIFTDNVNDGWLPVTIGDTGEDKHIGIFKDSSIAVDYISGDMSLSAWKKKYSVYSKSFIAAMDEILEAYKTIGSNISSQLKNLSEEEMGLFKEFYTTSMGNEIIKAPINAKKAFLYDLVYITTRPFNNFSLMEPVYAFTVYYNKPVLLEFSCSKVTAYGITQKELISLLTFQTKVCMVICNPDALIGHEVKDALNMNVEYQLDEETEERNDNNEEDL